jgi:homoserine dehydrogenase
MKTIRTLLIGLGNIGRRFCDILAAKDDLLRRKYGLDIVLVGAADSRGGAYSPDGLSPALLSSLKLEGKSAADYPGFGKRGWSPEALVSAANADLLLEATPVNIHNGARPAIDCIRQALQKGMNVVTPNKGPMVLAYGELMQLARDNGVALRFDGTVAGGLPAINIGQRDLRGATIHRIEAVPNLVTGFILDQMAEGVSWEQALAEARAEGDLEADPSWDTEGWDAAAKLVILANAVLDYPATLEEVSVEGIRRLAAEPRRIREAAERGLKYRLLAVAEQDSLGGYRLSVLPVLLRPEHPFARLGSKQMAVLYETDIYGTITAIIDERTPIPSAASMLRDILDIYCDV